MDTLSDGEVFTLLDGIGMGGFGWIQLAAIGAFEFAGDDLPDGRWICEFEIICGSEWFWNDLYWALGQRERT